MANNGESKPPPPLTAPGSPKPKSRPPTSRFGRLARLGALAPHALPVAIAGAKRMLGTRRSEEDEVRSRERMLADARKAAAALLKTLGDMKGLPLKVGQMASYIDGLAPPGYEEKVQRALRSLQEKAPPLSAAAAAKIVTEDLGSPPEQVFAAWQREPFAAASIGQVHCATTRGGDVVAVKVQYPGIDKAIENDLKSLALLEAFSSPLLRKYNTKETLDDIREVFIAELDYRREASMADTFRKIHRDVPDIVVPRVYHSLSTRRVLTAELIEGKPYQEFCQTASQEERDAAAVTIWQFMFRSLFSYGILYADPHPGNYRFLGGSRVAFLDYGCVKVLPDWLVAGLKRYMIAALDGDWAAFDRECVAVLGYDPSDPEMWKLYRSYSQALLTPAITDDVFEWSPKVARETVAYLVRGHRDMMFGDGRKLPKMPKPIRPPAEATFLNRLQWGLASIMGGLHARTRLRHVTEPWVREPRRALPV
jgi:predicted unusual protein kinase regulating ubiquinone biosynthesis (AarF/ABC1/UbiB family)